MTITAKNIGRINVWPTYDIAREADTEECKFVGQLTVWLTNEEAQANISHEEEGGADDRPDWVPANAVIHIDLIGGSPQGRAWTQADGEVAVDTLLGTDANTVTGWGASAYIPENLTVDGYGGDGAVAFIGAALAKLLAGSTGRAQWRSTISAATFTVVAVISADGAMGVQFDAVESNSDDLPMRGRSWGGSYLDTINGIVNVGTGALNVMAFTLTPTRGEFAGNGSTAAEEVLTAADFPTSGGSSLVAALFDLTGTGSSLQSITLYDPLPDTTGLSELSAIA